METKVIFLFMSICEHNVLTCFKKPQRQLIKVLNHINTIRSKMKFAAVIKIDNKVNFLKIIILHINNKFFFSVFAKLTLMGNIISNDSFYP